MKNGWFSDTLYVWLLNRTFSMVFFLNFFDGRYVNMCIFRKILISSILLLSSSLLWAGAKLHFCVYQNVPTFSSETFVFATASGQCVGYGEHITEKVTIPSNSKPGMYCIPEGDWKWFTEDNVTGACASEDTFVNFDVNSNVPGGTTSGLLQLYEPAEFNRLEFEGGVSSKLGICPAPGLCSDHTYHFHNSNKNVYLVWNNSGS